MAKRSVRGPKSKTMHKKEKYLLRLYITGNAPQSIRAIINLKRICEEHLRDRYELEIIDIYKRPELAKDEQIIAAPTLIKSLPRPFKKLIGDLSNEEKVLLGLDIRPMKKVGSVIDPNGC